MSVRLCTAGDSIMRGASQNGAIAEFDFVSPRGPLQRAITAAGYTDYTVIGVAGFENPVRDGGQPATAAQGGIWIGNESSGGTTVYSMLTALKAQIGGSSFDDLVLYLEGGANDAGGARSASEIGSDWAGLVAHARSLFPGAWLMCCGISPSTWIAPEQNEAARSAILAAASTDSKVISVDITNVALDPSDYDAAQDGTHYSTTGAQKVGAVMANAFIVEVAPILIGGGDSGVSRIIISSAVPQGSSLVASGKVTSGQSASILLRSRTGQTLGPFGNTSPGWTPQSTVDDMALENDFVLRGWEDKTSGWYVHSVNQMGARFNGQYRAAWDDVVRPAGQWQAIQSWIIICDGPLHNSATANVRVETTNGQIWIKRASSGLWVQVAGGITFSGGYFSKPYLQSTGDPTDEIIVAADGNAVAGKPPADNTKVWHAWSGIKNIPFDTSDASAVFVRCLARLIKDNPAGADTISVSQLGLGLGSDAYPSTSFIWTNEVSPWTGQKYTTAPGIFQNRTRRLTADWQVFSAMTFSDVGEQDPGSNYPRGGIPKAEFLSAPPAQN